MRILIAEDETIIRLDLRDLLERAGFSVCAEARDGTEAVELARSQRPDLAVLDVKMPRLDGIEATRRIKQQHPGVMVIFLTVYGHHLMEALNAGGSRYLLKDCTVPELLGAIRDCAPGQQSVMMHDA